MLNLLHMYQVLEEFQHHLHLLLISLWLLFCMYILSYYIEHNIYVKLGFKLIVYLIAIKAFYQQADKF